MRYKTGRCKKTRKKNHRKTRFPRKHNPKIEKQKGQQKQTMHNHPVESKTVSKDTDHNKILNHSHKPRLHTILAPRDHLNRQAEKASKSQPNGVKILLWRKCTTSQNKCSLASKPDKIENMFFPQFFGSRKVGVCLNTIQ